MENIPRFKEGIPYFLRLTFCDKAQILPLAPLLHVTKPIIG
jgi:hypothetical protein